MNRYIDDFVSERESERDRGDLVIMEREWLSASDSGTYFERGVENGSHWYVEWQRGCRTMYILKFYTGKLLSITLPK